MASALVSRVHESNTFMVRGVTHGGDVSPPKFELGGTQYTLSPPKNNKYYG